MPITSASSSNFTNGDGVGLAATDAIRRGVDTAGAALHSGIDKVANPARSAVDAVSTAAHESVDKMASTANNTADRFSTQTRRVTEAPARALESSKTWVQGKPIEAVGIALAFGFIVGRLTSR